LNLIKRLPQGHAPIGVGSMSLDKHRKGHSRTLPRKESVLGNG
jgi:hypothetical protein